MSGSADTESRPSFVVSHECPLDEASDAYTYFDAREEGWTKVVLKPGMAADNRTSGSRVKASSKDLARLRRVDRWSRPMTGWSVSNTPL